MKLAESMPTFVWLYRAGRQRLTELPRPPYIAFLVACIIATAVFPVALMLAGDLALLFWSEKQRSFRPSLMLRFLILAVVMEGFFLISRYRNPQVRPEYASMQEVAFMSLYGAQCVLLLIIEPGLRWFLRKRMA